MTRFLAKSATFAVLTTLLASGCGDSRGAGNGRNDDPRDASPQVDATSTTAERDGGLDGEMPSACSQCGEDEVCDHGACVPLPSQCPCPLESYCDLAENRCVRGCFDDEGCGEGRYCSAEGLCEDGCRFGGCGDEAVCNADTRVCECAEGTHSCGGRCVVEDVSSCGPTCEACPTDPLGQASCGASGCELDCEMGYEFCGGSCAPCPTAQATSFGCDGATCVALDCALGSHICDGACETEDVKSCGDSCASCEDGTSGACAEGSCVGMTSFGYFPKQTTCESRCASQGKRCSTECNDDWGGHEQHCATALRAGTRDVTCCCTDEAPDSPKPGCSKHSDCASDEFCWEKWNECYPTQDRYCPPGYTYVGRCSDGNSICIHSGLPTGTMRVFEKPCPDGTHQRGATYCSGETKICVPND